MKHIIIGGVAAGMSAASKIKRLAPEDVVVVYEKGGFLSYGACGLPYYVGDFNDDYRKMIARTKEAFDKAGIQTFIHHEVIAVNTEEKSVTVRNTKTMETFIDYYDKLMISTGANSFVPPFEGVELLGVHVLKTLEDGIFLREYSSMDKVKNVVIVGGGYIGVECAEAYLNLGKNVRLIEAMDRILMPFEPEFSLMSQEELTNHGVKLHLNEKVQSFSGVDTVTQIHTDKGTYEADLVIVAIGIRPATEFLTGTAILRNRAGAIIVDREMKTSVEHVYSAGDCALVYNAIMKENMYLALGTVANKCGRIAGANMAGAREKFIGALGTAAIKVCSLEIGRTGLSEQDAKNLKLNYATKMVTSYDHPGYYPGQTKLYLKVIYEKGTMKILGAQVAGEKGAVMRANIFAVAIQAKMTTEELGMIDLAYAPPFAGVWDAVHIASNACK